MLPTRRKRRRQLLLFCPVQPHSYIRHGPKYSPRRRLQRRCPGSAAVISDITSQRRRGVRVHGVFRHAVRTSF
jgi:hypothetical protein